MNFFSFASWGKDTFNDGAHHRFTLAIEGWDAIATPSLEPQ